MSEFHADDLIERVCKDPELTREIKRIRTDSQATMEQYLNLLDRKLIDWGQRTRFRRYFDFFSFAVEAARRCWTEAPG
jgi:hypothetical protein